MEPSRGEAQSEVFRVELTAEEAALLTSLLPKRYSIQLEPRRKDHKAAKKKTADELLLITPIDPPRPKLAPPPPPKKPTKVETISEAVKPCFGTLALLQQHKCALPFLEPVDVEGMKIPEYKQIVREPMDLSTIEAKLKSGKYSSVGQFHADVIKIFHNSYLFNKDNEDFVKLTNEFERYYYKVSGEPRPADKPALKPPPLPAKTQKKKKKPASAAREANESLPMTIEEKRELAANVHRLAKEHMKGVRSIVFEGGEGSEFDLEQLPQKKLRELQKYIRSKMAEMEYNLRSNQFEKKELQNLDDLDSEITQQFIEESL